MALPSVIPDSKAMGPSQAWVAVSTSSPIAMPLMRSPFFQQSPGLPSVSTSCLQSDHASPDTMGPNAVLNGVPSDLEAFVTHDRNKRPVVLQPKDKIMH